MRPSSMRIVIAGLLTAMACLLYLDRYAVGIAAERMRDDLGMTQTQMSWFLSAFFWAYALSQVPAGWLSDRFGPRTMLTAYILLWSLFTGLLGVTTVIPLILLWRFLCGASQAGAYPVASGMLRVWFPIRARGMASSFVAVGGRAGGVLAPLLTAALMTMLAGGWKSVLVLYGGIGILVAVAFAVIGRNRPEDHPLCNSAERTLIAESAAQDGGAAVPQPPFPWRPILTSVSLWGNSVTQVCTNIGWLFVVTWLPRYLERVHEIPLREQAVMTAIPTAAGIVGMFCGGRWTDASSRRLGLKWGRRLPVVSSRFTAAAGYAMCLALGLLVTPETGARGLPWAIIACLSLATFSVDVGVPAMWAYAQDVGGKFTASIMGWGNMWGNLGAAVAPLLYNAVLGESPDVANWNALFAMCALVFAVGGLSALVLDSTKPIGFEVAE